MAYAISQLTTQATPDGGSFVEVSQLSTVVTITASTLSAAASDNSYNDSGNGFVAAGFSVGDRINVTGFTGNTANNIESAIITAITAAKITIGGTDGDVIVDDAAGESVTITKWESVKASLDTIPVSQLLFGSTASVAAKADGIYIYDTSGDNPIAEFWQDDQATRNGYIQYASSGLLNIKNEVHGGPVQIQGEDNSGTVRNIVNGDPDGGVAFYYKGASTAQTVLASAGGLQANNQSTGGGMERVLTEGGDLDPSASYTATLTPGSSGTITLSGTLDSLGYERIGDVCHVHGRLQASSVSSPLGNILLNLPFTVANLTDAGESGNAVLAMGNIVGAAATKANDFVVICNGGAATATIYRVTATGIGNSSAPEVQASTDLYINLTFPVA